MVERLLPVKGLAVDLAESDGWTPLFFAAFNNFPEIVKLLLQSGADRNHASKVGYTIAQMLIDQPLPDVASILDSVVNTSSKDTNK